VAKRDAGSVPYAQVYQLQQEKVHHEPPPAKKRKKNCAGSTATWRVSKFKASTSSTPILLLNTSHPTNSQTSTTVTIFEYLKLFSTGALD